MTTFLSTRHLLAQSEQHPQYRQLPSSPNRVEGTLTGQERAGVVSSRQSRSITTLKKDCPTGTPVLLGPGDALGNVLVPNPIHLRWVAVPNIDHYHLSYSVNGKKATKVNTVQTEYVLNTLTPGSVVTWSLHAHGDDDADGGDNCKSPESAEKSFTVAPACTAPSITQQPAGRTIAEGASTTLTAAADGSSPSYQWYRGNTAVGTNSSSFNTGALTQTSTYHVVVTNSCGTVTSNDATVTVTPACTAPSIAQQPAGTTVTEGSSTTLTVSANGTNPSYQWYRGNTAVGTNSSSFNTGALTQTSTFRVVVTNSCGTVTSNDATVTVTPACTAPSIRTQPAGTIIEEGSSATLTVAADGTGPLTYQWYRGATAATTNSNSFTTGPLTQTSTFRVVVTNSCGTVTSNDVTVTVTKACTAPAIGAQPGNASITSGSSATLAVSATGTQPFTYQWYEGASGIRSKPVGTSSDRLTTGALTQTTQYWVEVRNSCGTVASNGATVTVTETCAPPAIGTQPGNAGITSGNAATLSVSATGTQPFTYQWYEGASGIRSKPVGPSSDRLTTGALTQTTQYWVEVHNSCGTVASNGATVTVTEACVPPSIGTQPLGVSIASGTTATFTVATTGTQPFTYQWYEGIAGQRTLPTGTNSDRLTTGFLSATTRYWVEVRNSCGAAASIVAVATVEPPTGNCGQLGGAPRASAVAAASSGVPYAVRWSGVANATAYDVQESATPSFEGAKTVRTTAPAVTYRHDATAAQAFYYRVRAISDCDGSMTAFSATVRVAVVPPEVSTSTDLIAPHGTAETILSRVTVNVDPSATAFTATASEPWINVTPASGSVPPSGQLVLTLTADPRSLPNGTSTASLRVITTGNSSRGAVTNGSTKLSIPISISLVTPVTPAVPSNGGEVLILPAVAHADGNNSKWQSDVRIAHTYDRAVRYLLTFTPSGFGLESAMQTELSVDATQTIALDDILGHWFGAGMAASGSTGVLEIRTLDAAVGTGRTLVTSRLFNVAPNGSFGQFIAAVPLSKFLGAPSTAAQTLVALSQSDRFRTNVGLVEGSGKAAKVLLEVFGIDGGKLFGTTLDLKAGEYRQIGGLLAENGIDAANARINVTMASPAGSVFSYASVIDNETGDPSFVPPVQAEATHARRYTIAGVANLDTGNGGKWQTDVRLFNGGAAAASTTIDFFVQGQSAAAATRTVDVAPGQMLVLDDVVQSLFGMTGAGGALRITTATDTALVPAARTYHKHDTGTYGQFIQAATVENTVGLGNEPLHILQVEESARFRTNVGVVETEGAPATIEITASLPNNKIAAVTQFELQPNEFRQMNALLRSMGLDDAYNASLTVRVIGGNGRAMAYGSVIDNQTQDPTYVMGY